MSRDIHPFGIRMPPDLKEQLEREAKLNGRSMNAELVERLRKSLQLQAEILQGGYSIREAPPPVITQEITDVERQLLAVFRKMAVEKQLGLISLLK